MNTIIYAPILAIVLLLNGINRIFGLKRINIFAVLFPNCQGLSNTPRVFRYYYMLTRPGGLRLFADPIGKVLYCFFSRFHAAWYLSNDGFTFDMYNEMFPSKYATSD
jgi:hypothetical protein